MENSRREHSGWLRNDLIVTTLEHKTVREQGREMVPSNVNSLGPSRNTRARDYLRRRLTIAVKVEEKAPVKDHVEQCVHHSKLYIYAVQGRILPRRQVTSDHLLCRVFWVRERAPKRGVEPTRYCRADVRRHLTINVESNAADIRDCRRCLAKPRLDRERTRKECVLHRVECWDGFTFVANCHVDSLCTVGPRRCWTEKLRSRNGRCLRYSVARPKRRSITSRCVRSKGDKDARVL